MPSGKDRSIAAWIWHDGTLSEVWVEGVDPHMAGPKCNGAAQAGQPVSAGHTGAAGDCGGGEGALRRSEQSAGPAVGYDGKVVLAGELDMPHARRRHRAGAVKTASISEGKAVARIRAPRVAIQSYISPSAGSEGWTLDDLSRAVPDRALSHEMRRL